MEEKKLTEKESLELITQMIQSTKKNMKVGSGNQFLYWGYFTVTLSLFIYIMGYTTHNNSWNWCWMLMFVFWIKELIGSAEGFCLLFSIFDSEPCDIPSKLAKSANL